MREIHRFVFPEGTRFDRVGDSLFLASVAAEGLYGRAQCRLEAAYRLDAAQQVCVIEVDTPFGQSLSRIFTEFLSRELGEGAFGVERQVIADNVNAPNPKG